MFDTTTAPIIRTTRSKPQKSYIVHVIVVAALAAAGYVGWDYKQRADYKAQVEGARVELQAIQRQWQDAYSLALTTSRVGLAGPIASMQAIARRAEDVKVPLCLANAKNFFIAGAHGGVNAMQMFQSQANDGLIIDPRLKAEANIKQASDSLAGAAC